MSAMTPSMQKAKRVIGKALVFRDVSVADAEFILALRTNTEKGRYLSFTPYDVERQRTWLMSYATSSNQAYFIIEAKNGEPLGTVRLYDPRGDSFCWGSWILKYGAPTHAAIESALMVYAYAIDHLGFRCAHFDVRKDNKNVWRFHERFGAKRVGESEADYFYSIDAQAIAASRQRYERYLPSPIVVES